MSVSRRTVTVLFADVADFTPLGERLDPETLRKVMSSYFSCVRMVLEGHGGTVEKFIGDAVMAVFGVPEVHEDDALRAVRAASELRGALARLNDDLDRELHLRIGVRVGLNTGEVVAGDASAGQALVSGDVVNTAQRLESAAASSEILIGEATQRLVKGATLLEPVDAVAAKGKSEPVRAWRVLAAIPGLPAISRRFDSPLVGREEELARLHAAFERAVGERVCYLVTLLGSAGIGKSRLAAELFDELGDRAAVLIGRCLPYGEGITFWPLIEVLRDVGGDEAIAELLTGTEDAELVVERLSGVTGRSPSAGTQATFWAVRKVCEALARRRPLVLCFEDLHWAEPTFLDLVEYLGGWIRDAPILLLCLARPDFLDGRSAGLPGQENAASLTLHALSSADSEAMLDALGVDADERPRIVAAADGNPLYVEQMAAMLAEDGNVAAIPPTIHALLAARLDRLSIGERSTIERAAVAGKEFWRDAVIELTPEDEREGVGAHLLSLVRKDLIRPHRSSARPDDAFAFGHVLIRDAAYAAIPKERRAALHERFAEWLSTSAGARTAEVEEIVGYHYEQAFCFREQLGPIDNVARRLADRAGELLGNAGHRAFARSDMPAAVNLLSRALALLDARHPVRLEALPELGSALMTTGDFSRADAVLTQALNLAVVAGDKRLEVRTLIEREFFRTFTNPESSTEELIRVAENAIPLLEQLGDEFGLAKAWWLRSEADVIAGRWGARAEALERALTHARRADHEREEATIIALLAQALLYGPTPVPDAIRRCLELRASAPDNPAVEAAIESTLAGLNAMEDRFDEARAGDTRARALYNELGLRYLGAAHSLVSASIELLDGDIDAAVRELRSGYEALEQMGERGTRSTVAAFLAQALVAQRRYEEAEEFTRISEETGATADVVTQAVWRSARARALAHAGDAPGADRLAREAVDLANNTDFPELQATTMLSLAEIRRLENRANEAGDLAERARERYERKGNVAAARQAAAFLAEPVR